MKSSSGVLVFAVVVASLSAERAVACGGLFCAAVSPTPVDQTSEKIIFEVDETGAVTATVEVRYEGNPQDFSWIIPVPGTPDFVDVAGKDELLLLDAATAPTFTFPTVTGCGGGGGFGCASEALASARDGAASEGEGESGVRVTQYPSVGPFDDIVAVEGGDPQVLAQWLRDNGYQVTDGMIPFITDYTLEAHKFLAVRLRSDAEVRDIVPIRFHCPVPDPAIPLRLTAIAAEPQMGFLVFVIGPRRYTTGNSVEVFIDPADVHIDPFGQNNYLPLVSKRVDEAGGFGFVVERAQPAELVRQRVQNTFLGTEDEVEARERLETLLADGRFVTRFYSRLDPDEMIADPDFVPAAEGTPDVTGIIDLSTQVYDNCQVPTMPICGGLYCGANDACAGSDLGDGCVCGEGRVARVINGPSGRLEVACSSLTIDLHGAGTDACSGQACGGLGTCVPLNDRATCRCDEGAVAVVDRGLLTCVPQTSPIYDSDMLLWPPFVDDAGCAASHRRAGGSLSLLLLFGSALVMRLRRRG